jgi:hypothetical protein
MTTDRSRIFLILALTAPLAFGCATKKFVRAEVGGAEERSGTRVTAVESQIEEAQDAIAETKTQVGQQGQQIEQQSQQIQNVSKTAQDALERALAAGKLAEGRAKKFAADETADPEILLTVATTAIAAGKLGAARRDLARARQLFRAAGKTPADLHFADAELHAALARRAADTDKKIELLERARSSYRRFARSGAGFRVGQASERAAEISTEITRLLAQ